MYLLKCSVQKYVWGKRGDESKVAVFKHAQDSHFQVNKDETYAELWMGTHPNGPSFLQKDSDTILLKDYLIEKGDEALGSRIAPKFYTDGILSRGDLPFLFKVLSINQALSIQAHPNRKLARELRLKDPKNYPDSNHKPEMLLAISEPFEAMCGFRPHQQICAHFRTYPELVELCGKSNCAEFMSANNDSDKERALRECFTALMNNAQEAVDAQFKSLKLKLETIQEAGRDYLQMLILRLAKSYPNDVGCFSIFLMNCLSLRRGEAIYLAANVPHAYLFGEGVECMACSDNVVRAGLTPKFKDVRVLCEMLDYSMRSAEDNLAKGFQNEKEYLVEFRPDVDEFSIEQIRIENVKENVKFSMSKRDSASILIIIEASGGHFEFDSERRLECKSGLVFFIDANLEFTYVAESTQHDNKLALLAYRAFSDIKS